MTPALKDVIALGCSEVILRVSQYDWQTNDRTQPTERMTPVEWQAIARHQDSTKPWGVAVRDNPDQALLDCLAEFKKLHTEGKDKPKPAKVTKTKLPELDQDAMDLI